MKDSTQPCMDLSILLLSVETNKSRRVSFNQALLTPADAAVAV
jgi:hypothetical protein